MRTPEQLRCGTKVKTANGWYPVVRIMIRGGAVYSAYLLVGNKEKEFDAATLCKHITDWEPL